MNWQKAQQSTVELWQRILASVGEADEVELLSEINAACALCETADEVAAGRSDRCRYCLASDQLGGCKEINFEMSERVVERDWEGLRELIRRYIDDLQSMRVSTDSSSGAPPAPS
ncbi:MAG: hypothetical protein R3244_00785 [Thermoanaerobaculia bacterium]|nr:hypothetical protein [Thermoanaerobaculia bacterium]